MIRDYFKILLYDLTSKKGTFIKIDGRDEVAGGSGLAALLFNKYCKITENWDNPEQSIIFTIGPLTGYFPLMSKTVCAFKSPYHNQYAESHGGGRSALCMRFADIDGLVITGKAKRLSCLYIGSRNLELKEVHYLRGIDVQVSGKILRNMFKRRAQKHSENRTCWRKPFTYGMYKHRYIQALWKTWKRCCNGCKKFKGYSHTG